MTDEKKLELLDEAREEVAALDERRNEILQEIKEKLGLSKQYDREIWEFVVGNLKFARNLIKVAIHTNEGKDA